MSDDDAYMALVLNNAQGELTPLEIGVHALGSGLTQRAYAEKVGMAASTLQYRWQAAAVAQACTHMSADVDKCWATDRSDDLSQSAAFPSPQAP
jgi:hypothetical protein